MLSEGGQRTFIVVDGPNDTILVVGWTLVTLYGEEAQQMLANKSVKSEKGTPLSKKDEFEWMELFEENKQKALSLKAEVHRTDKEIDQIVYELYGLTEEEIKIVEGTN